MVSLCGEALRHPRLLEPMGQSLRLRGPDGHGLFKERHVGLGHERLRIVDLHERADQPFSCPDAHCRLVCNGEIYNSEELRQRYRDYPFRSHSDVETILPLFLDRGVEGLAELDGMFSLVLWDESTRTLTLGRDRAGEKPLFYRRVGGEVWFASEVQALLLAPAFSRDLDETAISQYLTLGYVPEPRTMFREIKKIGAGTLVRFTAEGDDTFRYWRPETIVASGTAGGSAAARLSALLQAAVRKQLAADVPVGVFVSGGLDSSLLASLAVQESDGKPIHTFAARFSEHSYDEADWAAECARRLGTEHREVLVDESSLAEALRAVTENLAEPLADPAILPTYLLAREAHKHVKVILSGEGADELFGGYPTYLGHKVTPWAQALPSFLRRLLGTAAGLLPTSRRKVTFEFLLKRFLAGVDEPSLLDRHLRWFGPAAQDMLATTSGASPSRPDFPFASPAANGIRGAMLLDYRSYLRDNLLVKVDRATMLHSVEARAPFLDRDLSAFALALPDHLRVRGLTTKPLLKKVALEWLPKQVVYRRKRGLSVPVASWIDGGLRPEVDRLMDSERLQRQRLLDPRRVARLLAEHRSGHANHARPLWTLIVFQYWLERWAPERAG